MNPDSLNISGDWHRDPVVLEKFSRDMSAYRIVPALVVEPKNEEDVLRTLQFARTEGLSIVPRAGGSDLSGASIGPGIVLNFKKYFNRVVRLDEEAVVEPGMILDEFVRKLTDHDLMLPAVPSSSALCALGGNVGTRATGPRTAKYGTLDAFVTSLRFITAAGEVVDTARSLPEDLASGLGRIQQKFLADASSRVVVARRPFIAGGYNLGVFAKYDDMRQLATHLLVGSTGTLGIVTEIRLKPILRTSSQGTLVAHFRDHEELADAALRMKSLDPAALEYSDASCAGHVSGKILNLEDPAVVGTMIAEFDGSVEQVRQGLEILEKFNVSRTWTIRSGSPEETALWQDRRRTQPALLKYCRRKNLLLTPIIDDIAIHLQDFGPVISGLRDLMRRLGHDVSIYGHLGFGSLHARPYFDATAGELPAQIERVSTETFKLLQKYNGTLVGEHNAGRSRSMYLQPELGPAYGYLRAIKELFDPDDILNPGCLFDTAPILAHLDLTVR